MDFDCRKTEASALRHRLVKGTRLTLAMAFLGVMTGGVLANDNSWWSRKKSDGTVSSGSSVSGLSNLSNRAGKATTQTEIVADRSETPMLSSASEAAMQAAIARYEAIQANGGWAKVSVSSIRVGTQGNKVAALKSRLVAEGYLAPESLLGETGVVFTQEVGEALGRFQKKHGLAVTGRLDKVTVAELNVPVSQRIATLRANLPRIQEYSKDLGGRYIVVNVPALQLETVSDSVVFSRHNIIAGQPLRPSPVVMTNISDINFNPYWNAPVSIVEKDIIPMVRRQGVKYITQQGIRVFDGYNGPEVDPRTINWKTLPADRYFFRQDPGDDNAMATVKINFKSPFGIYLHDTPTKSLFGTGSRYLSSGCIRVDQVQVLVNWTLNGQDGWDPARIEQVGQSKERIDVNVNNGPQLRVAYLTAWTTSDGPADFRSDIYNLDSTGFVVGQPLAPGELSEDGRRYILKAPPRQPSSSTASAAVEEEGSPWFLSSKSKRKTAATSATTRKRPLTTNGQAERGSFASFFSFSPTTKKKVATTKTTKKPATKTAQTNKKKKPVTAKASTGKTATTKTAAVKKKPTTAATASAKQKPATAKTAAAEKAKTTTAVATPKKKKKKVEEVAAAAATPPAKDKTTTTAQ
jgi:L,D-transpeptidase YcbB